MRLRSGRRKTPHFETLRPGLVIAQICENGKLAGIGKTKKEAAARLQEELNAMYDRLKSITEQSQPRDTPQAASVIGLTDFIKEGLGATISEANEEARHCAEFFATLIRADGERHGAAQETAS